MDSIICIQLKNNEYGNERILKLLPDFLYPQLDKIEVLDSRPPTTINSNKGRVLSIISLSSIIIRLLS
jgi:hypothetical protein